VAVAFENGTTMLRWGIAGTGFISNTVVEAIGQSHGSVITAVAGRDAARLAEFQQRHRIAKGYDSYEALIADPEVDVVYIGLPNNVHHTMTIKAAASGKHVLSEKSLTTTMDEARALSVAVAMGGVFFVEGLMYLAHPLFARLGEIIRDGRLGTIRSISGLYAADIWQVVNPAGNGALYNLGCYPASLLQFVIQTAFGEEAFVDRQVSGFGNISPHDGNVRDATLSVRFGNGVLANLQTTEAYGMAHEFTILGDKGSLRFVTNPWLPVEGPNVMELSFYDGTRDTVVAGDGHDAFYHQVKMVERHIAAGDTEATRPSPRLGDSMEVMELLTEWEAVCRTVPI
jgi:dihydrodiol dehydrogenase / D-xylose 1-dehydrogenase (NADP)